MKLVVLGANGQLGSDVVSAASARERFEVEGLSRAHIDVTDASALQKVLGDRRVDAIVNCTSYHKTDEVEDNAGLGVAVNAHAVAVMAELARSINARFVHFSTDYVFSGDSDVPYSESDAATPINVYGSTKHLGETLALRANPHSLLLRVASLFGVAGSSGKGGNFVETMISLARDGREISVVDDVRMCPTSTVCVANALLDLLGREPSGGLYHMVNSGDASWYEFACEVFEVARLRNVRVKPVASSEYPTRAIRPKYSVLDCTALADARGGEAMVHWKQALREYMRSKHGCD